MRTFACGLIVAVMAATGVAEEPAKKKSLTERDFLGVWLEEHREHGGKAITDRFEMLGWDLEKDDAGIWLIRGEAVYTQLGKARLRLDKNPVWLDVVKVKQDGKAYIKPGIVKREGKKLIWFRADDWFETEAAKLRDWPKRPQSFNATKDKTWIKTTLRRGDGRYAIYYD